MIKKVLHKTTIAIAPHIASSLIRFLAKTMRITYINFEKIWGDWQRGKNVIVAFWHGRLMMMPLVYKGRGITILVSQHRDGELIARTVKRLGIDSVRGSSTRGWLGGVKGLLNEMKKGKDIAITPDGPKGPRFIAQTWIIGLAKITGLPIIPMTFGASKKKLLKAGMPSYCHIRFQKAYLSAASQSL
ncbi:MAG: lysophospholipid acyltransferase family protein [Deltaproteobacteria bacterium]|nr:lysophospholipid acyltransferase family protein [Deltaproteobacteria bacterium]